MAQGNVTEPNGERSTEFNMYAPRKYSGRETFLVTIKLLLVSGFLLAMLWIWDALIKG